MFNRNISFIIFFFVLISATLTQANNKTLYIDMDYIMNNSIAGKSITEQLKKKK